MRFENEMVMTNKINDSSRGDSNLRETLEFR